tara:strand:- start:283 stop:609 length:327 start_codon:yes stop_codon:yes gene_type:complete
MTNITQLRTFFIVSIICLGLNGCTFFGVPWQISTAATAGDIISVQNHGKTMSETAASITLQRDCQWSRMLIGWAPCLTREEYVSNLMKMNCKTYSWNFLNIPYCKESQ